MKRYKWSRPLETAKLALVLALMPTVVKWWNTAPW